MIHVKHSLHQALFTVDVILHAAKLALCKAVAMVKVLNKKLRFNCSVLSAAHVVVLRCS